eukprot:TRINITY_DN74930_c0_g1_i1.p1 TRINITY_DN74930_c0_g1~~TRINITY_DN74930_c0_g1_i1.p1  ORF type:complete len:163 (-),score=30.70 TRINITY_DN74930_c0_g1_i1:139-555(-)
MAFPKGLLASMAIVTVVPAYGIESSCPAMPPEVHHHGHGSYGEYSPCDETLDKVVAESKAKQQVVLLLQNKGINVAEEEIKPCFYQTQIVNGQNFLAIMAVDGVSGYYFDVEMHKPLNGPASVMKMKTVPARSATAIV